MDKPKRWQFVLIISVILLTIYNILPTVFYYAKPLKRPIDETRAQEIATSIAGRVNSLESEALSWLEAYCTTLGIKARSIALESPHLIKLSFKSLEDANRLRQHLPRAGSLIPFVPAQLTLHGEQEMASTEVVVKRAIPIHLDASMPQELFQFSTKLDNQGKNSPLFRELTTDRALELGILLGGPTDNSSAIDITASSVDEPHVQEALLSKAQNILSMVKAFGENSAIASRYYASYTQSDNRRSEETIDNFLAALKAFSSRIAIEKNSLKQEAEALKAKGGFLEPIKQQRLDHLSGREKTLAATMQIVVSHKAQFTAGKTPWTYAELFSMMQTSSVLELEGRDPFLKNLIIDWASGKILLTLQPDVLQFKKQLQSSSQHRHQRDLVDQLLYDEIATISRRTGEQISPLQDRYEISLSTLAASKSFLTLKLSKIAESLTSQILSALTTAWNPKSSDLLRENFPVVDYASYQGLSPSAQKLSLVVYSPLLHGGKQKALQHRNSLYVIAKGLGRIVDKLRSAPDSAEAKEFMQDFSHLQSLLQQNGYFGYSGKSLEGTSEFANDYIFEAEDYFQTLIKATREDFSVHGTKRYAVLEFSDVEQRILTENKIANRIHEDLQKWTDDYRAAQLGLRGSHPYDVPKPTKSVFWSNLTLSAWKYFRGDDRKILHWGLDLSGGKTVQIELRDVNNRIVTDEDDLKQGINELYKRVNKMGVSEVSIRKEGNTIALDFPGQQGLSAAELVKASTMVFHIVNEKFSLTSPALAASVQQFLQEVWNEAIVTNRKEEQQINLIAYLHLYGDSFDPDIVEPRSESAKILYDNGLLLSNPEDPSHSSAFNDSLSKIAIQRGDSYTEWNGASHPLMIVFKNFALEGSNLDNVHASYDPAKGNFLAFNIKSSQTLKDGRTISPQEDLFLWTSQFAKEKVVGTPLEAYSQGHGWRMAVVLNGTIISAPTLDSALRDSAMISGSFTQREINQLEADLKAGSLSFTPRILSEKNVSPELGAKERIHGIVATILSLLLVIAVMGFFYRFAGAVASIAVLFNLLILWAALQNLQATMTLAGIAGIILTVGMAVDANVLVFERFKEEYALSGRIVSALSSAYRKALSAILDSNLTTLIAALILLHFDSGPVKGFAVTLIIGIISSLFTALFMTRIFFARWAQNPQHQELKMLSWLKNTNFNFLKQTRITVLVSIAIICIGGALVIVQRSSFVGMDFTGGYGLTLELKDTGSKDYRAQVEKALLSAGVSSQDVQIRELSSATSLRLFFSRNLDKKAHPFYDMPLQTNYKEVSYPFQNNPRIVWVVQAMMNAKIPLNPAALTTLDQSWTQVSGQMSETMRTNAALGLGLALLCILIYITLRFEFKYAISATICLAHDILFTVAAMGILHFLGVSIQIDLHTVAALLTITGYSLNDTIIVFDRIREEMRLKRSNRFGDVINHALNITLSRTLMTSGITLLVLLPLIVLGGSTLFGFALVMFIGVLFGTLSSLYIAAPLMQYFHKKEKSAREIA